MILGSASIEPPTLCLLGNITTVFQYLQKFLYNNNKIGIFLQGYYNCDNFIYLFFHPSANKKCILHFNVLCSIYLIVQCLDPPS